MSRAFNVLTAFGLLLLASSNAFAQAAAPAGQPPAYMQLVPVIGLVVIMYFLMLRPQMKKQKEQQEFLTKLERGTEVITTSGILGRIEGLTDLYVTLEIAPNTRIKILRTAVAGLAKNAVSKAPAQGQEVKS